MKLKVEQFPFYNLVTVCFDYASEILHTRYRESVQYILFFSILFRIMQHRDILFLTLQLSWQ
jgi:hypothetical protein